MFIGFIRLIGFGAAGLMFRGLGSALKGLQWGLSLRVLSSYIVECRLSIVVGTTILPLPSKDSNFKAFGPKDPII